jgi:metal-responsive CopG/Arc/MetJ family transcriptional regulator
MAQITATIPDDVVKRIDISALEKGISRSKWVAQAIDTFLSSGLREGVAGSEHMGSVVESNTLMEDSLQKAMTASQSDIFREQEHMKEEIQRLMHEVEGKNQVIRLQSDEISWLRGECAKITDRMIMALPSPRQHWWEFWRQKTG